MHSADYVRGVNAGICPLSSIVGVIGTGVYMAIARAAATAVLRIVCRAVIVCLGEGNIVYAENDVGVADICVQLFPNDVGANRANETMQVTRSRAIAVLFVDVVISVVRTMNNKRRGHGDPHG